jgi:hypothetical protein
MPYIGVSPQFGVRRKHTYTATAGQTSFSGAGSEGATLSYTDSNFVDVYQNGVKLGDADYTSTSGTAIVLAQGASVDDLLEIIVFDAFSAADTVSKADGGTFDGNVTMAGTLGVTGATTLTGGVSGNTTFSGEIITSTSGTSNLRIGENAGDAIASGGNYNTVVGDEAGTSITTGDNNTALGYQAGASITTTSNCTVVGHDAGGDITTGTQNTILGSNAGNAITEGQYNVAIGVDALGADTKGSKNVAIGNDALNVQNFPNATDSNNVAVGYGAGKDITDGQRNVLVGSIAGEEITDADDCIGVGYRSCGGGAGSATTGHDNVCVGTDAGQTLTSGAKNTCIGRDAGTSITDGSQNSCIGFEANVASSGANNSFTLGNSDITTLRCNQTSISSLSDERDKTNIEDLSSDAGLKLINNLRPVTFNWDRRDWYEDGKSDGSKVKTKFDKDVANSGLRQGFIAQEVANAVKGIQGLEDDKIILDDNPDKLEFAPAKLITNLVKAIQELSAENKTQATQIADLISRVTALENAE